MRRYLIVHARWLFACGLLIVQRLLVMFICVPMLAIATWFFMAQGNRTMNASIEGASYFWRPLPPRPGARLRERVKATILPPLDSSPKRRIP